MKSHRESNVHVVRMVAVEDFPHSYDYVTLPGIWKK